MSATREGAAQAAPTLSAAPRPVLAALYRVMLQNAVRAGDQHRQDAARTRLRMLGVRLDDTPVEAPDDDGY